MNLKTLIAALAIGALAIAACGTAVAADPPVAPTATPVKHPTLKSCNREATAKQLAGKQREQYVRDCTAGKAQAAPQAPATKPGAQPASH